MLLQSFGFNSTFAMVTIFNFLARDSLFLRTFTFSLKEQVKDDERKAIAQERKTECRQNAFSFFFLLILHWFCRLTKFIKLHAFEFNFRYWSRFLKWPFACIRNQVYLFPLILTFYWALHSFFLLCWILSFFCFCSHQLKYNRAAAMTPMTI